MSLEMNARNRRALLGLGLALVVYGLLRFVAFPIQDRLGAAAETAAQKQDELRRFRRAQMRKGQYAQLTELQAKKSKEAESVLLSAANPSLVSAELQSLVEAAGMKAGITFVQRNVGTPKRLNEFYGEFTITVGFDSTPGQLTMFLSDLRAAPKFITVRSLQVSPVQPVQEIPKGVDLSKNVHVTMTLAALSVAEMAGK
jgi:Tfp pilus assembly protein PilO